MGFYARCLKLAIAKESRHPQMVISVERYDLRPVRSPCEWDAYHAIRQDAIFAALLPGQPYDECDAAEFAPGHFPHVLVYDGEIIGTVRIDLIGEKEVGLRLIGVRGDLQRRGHGRALLRFAEQAARALGKTEIVINAHPSSLAFYVANGYREGAWDDAGPPRPGLIRVGKRLP